MNGEEFTFNTTKSFFIQLLSLLLHANLKLLDLNLFVLGPEEQKEEVNKLDWDANEISLDQNKGHLRKRCVISGVEPVYETKVDGEGHAKVDCPSSVRTFSPAIVTLLGDLSDKSVGYQASNDNNKTARRAVECNLFPTGVEISDVLINTV